jgi:hypothetical protein
MKKISHQQATHVVRLVALCLRLDGFARRRALRVRLEARILARMHGDKNRQHKDSCAPHDEGEDEEKKIEPKKWLPLLLLLPPRSHVP